MMRVARIIDIPFLSNGVVHVITMLVRSDDPFLSSFITISSVYDTEATEHDTRNRM